MIPRRPFVRCARYLGKSVLWLILILNIVIFMKVLSKGLMGSSSASVFSHSGRQVHSVLPPSEGRRLANETVVILVANTDVNQNLIGEDDGPVEESVDVIEENQINDTKIKKDEPIKTAEELTNNDNQKTESKAEEVKEVVTVLNCTGVDVQSEKCKGKHEMKNLTTATKVVRTTNSTEKVSIAVPWYDQEWHFNSSAAAEIRDLLEQECHTNELFLTTQKNVLRNSTLPYEGEPRKRLLITSQVHSILPEVMPYTNRTFKKCSIVGSSGILLGSKCGPAIDDSDFVIRMNLPSIYNYTDDVGTRTNFVTCNPTLVRSGFAALSTREARQDFINFLKEFGNSDLYLPAFAFKTSTEPAFKVFTTLRATGRKVLFAHPDHMWLVKKFWVGQGVNAIRISSGMLLFTIGMSICDELHVYGFWPFETDIAGRHAYYHYFDKKAYMLNKKKRLMHWHEMPSEFELLRQLHMKGAIHLHVKNCTAPASL